MLRKRTIALLAGGTLAIALVPWQAQADQVILDDLIVDGSICVGLDCVNGESFGFDTLRLKENNLRIKAQDTSTSASFPTNDWQITFNASSNGGANKFSIDDIDGGRTPFTIEAGAPTNSLYVDDGGRLGLGTNVPVVDVHVKSGNTPTLRLEQDGSSGFAPQTWDVAGNETNFFIRDATNGSTLPLRIFPSAPSSSLEINSSDGSTVRVEEDVALLDIGGGSAAQLRIETDTSTNRRFLARNSSGTVSQMQFDDDAVVDFLGATGSVGSAIRLLPRSQPTSLETGMLWVEGTALCFYDGSSVQSLSGTC